ncbi:MAG: hypothetical protein EHM45_17005, partial [Desulfobacteraceae bacterium]
MKEKIRTRWLRKMLCCLVSLGLTLAAGAANRAIDLKTAGLATGGRRMVFLLEGPPRYGLELRSEDLVLTFYDTQKSNLVAQKITALTPWLQTEAGAAAADLKLLIKLAGAPAGIQVSWAPKQKVFYLEINDAPAGAIKKSKDRVSLQRVRFGIQEEYTRIVLDCDRSPLWEIQYRDNKQIHWFLEALATPQAGKKFGPFRRVKEVQLQDRKQKTDLTIQLEEASPRINLVWEATDKKLILDLIDRPFEIQAKELDFAFSAPNPEQPAAGPVIALANSLSGVSPVADLKTATAGSGTSAVPGPQDGKQTTAADNPLPAEPDEKPAMINPLIPVQGPEPSGPAPKDPGAKPASAYADLKIEPLIETGRPGVFSRDDLIKKLNGDEAFLFGRIQEAWEIKDYEKGVGLIARYLETFPQSALNESLAFLQGDFLLALMKSGRKEIMPQVIRAYQEAATRFENSPEVPYALLKIAQTYAFTGDYYNALGNLSIIIANFPKGEHIQAAYLTRGKVQLQIKQPEKAIADFKYVLEHFPKSSFANEARYGIAEYFHSEAVYDEAERRLKEIEENDRRFYLQYPEYLFLHAKNLFYLKEYDGAREYYFRALNLGRQPEPGDLLLAHIGDTFFQQERNEEAGKFYQLAVDYYPQSEGAAIARIRLAGAASGVSGFQEVVGDNVPKPIHDIAMLKMARKQYDERQYAAALQTLEKLMTQLTTPGDLKKEAAALYAAALEEEFKRLFQAGQYEELVGFYRSREGQIPVAANSGVLLMLAQAYHENRQYRQALAVFQKVKTADLTPELKSKYVLKMAESYFEEGESKKSEELLKKGLAERLLPDDQQRMTLILGRIFQKKGDLKQAYQATQSVVNGERLLLDHEIAGAYLFMGQISITENKYEKSREALNRCIALAEK